MVVIVSLMRVLSLLGDNSNDDIVDDDNSNDIPDDLDRDADDDDVNLSFTYIYEMKARNTHILYDD